VDGFAGTFKEAVGRWRRRHRHPPPHEQWFAVHYRAGWLVEKLTTLESVYLLRQGLDVRALAAERPPRKKGKDGQMVAADSDEEGDPDDAAEPTAAREAEPARPVEPTTAREAESARPVEPTTPPALDAG
jgi:hypothetical protein